MRSARPPLWHRMRRFPALVVFALALPILLYGLVGSDPLAHDITPHPDIAWDGDPDHGTVKVSKTQSGDGVDRIGFTINEGQSVSYYFKATHPPGGTNWFIRIMVDGKSRTAGNYKGIEWSPQVGRSLNTHDYDDWKRVTITATQDDISHGTRTITIDHEVWGNNGDCPIHEVGTVVVTVIDDDGSSPPPPPPPPPQGNNNNELGGNNDGVNNDGDNGIGIGNGNGDHNSDDGGDGNGGGLDGNGGGSGDGDGDDGGRDGRDGSAGDGNGDGGSDGDGDGGTGDGNGGGGGDAGSGEGGDSDGQDGDSDTEASPPPPPPAISIADATVNEGETAVFPVTLSAASRQAVTVRYETADGTAVAGSDFEAASGTLTFAPGTLRRIVKVRTLADDDEEPRETFGVTLSAPTGATLRDAAAVGTIAADAEGRIARASESILPEIGRAVAFTPVRCRIEQAFSQGNGGLLQSSVRPSFSVASVAGPWDASREGSLSLEQSLDGASFLLPLTSVDGGVARFVTWGCGDFRQLAGAVAGEGRTWDGGVSTMQIGIDALVDSDTLAGVALSRAGGAFDYSGTGGNGDTGGDFDLGLTGVHPYFGVSLSPDLRAWGTIGIADGELRVVDDRADKSMTSSATLLSGTVGLNGRVLTDEETTVTLKGEMAFARLDASNAEAAFKSALANLSRLRFAAQADYKYPIPHVGLLTPWAELGLRHDGGDGEAGVGLEMSGGLRYRNIAQGWNAEAYGRWLAVHADALPEEQGFGFRLRYDPDTLGFGPWASLGQTWGQPSSVLPRLWEDGADGPVAHDLLGRRLDLEVGYGLPAYGGRASLTPYGAVSLEDSDVRSYRLGMRLMTSSSALLSLETERRERPAAPDDHRIVLRAIARY